MPHSPRDSLAISSKWSTTEKLGIVLFFFFFLKYLRATHLNHEVFMLRAHTFVLCENFDIFSVHSILAVQMKWLKRKELKTN